MHYNTVIFGTKDTTVEMLKYLKETLHEQIDLLVTVSDKVTKNVDIAGLASVGDVAESYGLEVFFTDSYSLRDDKCNAFFNDNTFGIGISMGWQRLIPPSVLCRFNKGVFGFHGSCGYLPFGRGRSPLNWSVLLGDKRFILNLFQYDEEADSPNVFMNTMFEITPHDNIRTLQYKNTLVSRDMIKKLLKAYREDSITINTKTADFDTWYDKRTPEDGKIDFTKRTEEIYNLIRSVTKPFAGAFCCNGDNRIIIWDAAPFDMFIDFSAYAPGEVIDVFDNNPIIRTLDGSLLIKEYEGSAKLTPGSRLT